MNPTIHRHKGIARTVGILYVIGTIAGVLSVQFLKIRNEPDYLAQIDKHPYSLVIGAILTLIMGFALALIPVFLFPVLKNHSETAGVGYIVFRGGLETCSYMISSVCYLALTSLGAAYAAGVQDVAQLYGAGAVLNAIADSSVTAFVFGMGALIFYSALVRFRLVPWWISVFGLVAVVLHILSGVLVLLGMQENFDTGSMIMNLPIAVQEMVLAVWLILWGFTERRVEECK